MNQDKMGQGCSCPHHMVMPILIMLLGLVFLLKAWGVMTADMTDMIWPIIIILIGLMKLMGKKCKCCGHDGGSCCMTKPEAPKVQ